MSGHIFLLYDEALIEIFMKKLILRGCALKQKNFVKYRPAIQTLSLAFCVSHVILTCRHVEIGIEYQMSFVVVVF